MSEFNEKALYFCHTHPNLFLQKNCKSCRRGMCQECINMTNKSSKFYESKRELIKSLAFSILISLIFPIYNLSNQLSISNSEFLIDYFTILFYALSIGGAYFLLRNTEFLDDIKAVPFIGYKLAIIVLIIIIALGIPVFYITYKLIYVIKHYYFNRRPKVL